MPNISNYGSNWAWAGFPQVGPAKVADNRNASYWGMPALGNAIPALQANSVDTFQYSGLQGLMDGPYPASWTPQQRLDSLKELEDRTFPFLKPGETSPAGGMKMNDEQAATKIVAKLVTDQVGKRAGGEITEKDLSTLMKGIQSGKIKVDNKLKAGVLQELDFLKTEVGNQNTQDLPSLLAAEGKGNKKKLDVSDLQAISRNQKTIGEVYEARQNAENQPWQQGFYLA
jgi:hypothetical protein